MNYQICHRHYGDLTQETDAARSLLLKHGRCCPEAVRELRDGLDLSISECADMLRCVWRDMQTERLQTENERLRELAKRFAESIANDGCEFCPYEEGPCDVETYPMYDGCRLYEELRELGVGE